MLKTNGRLPNNGEQAPQLRYVLQDKSNADLLDHRSEVVILCTMPSVDTSTCALQTRTFNQRASDLGATVLIVSLDLPFAFRRFCAAEGITNVITGSDFRFRDAAEKWGARLIEGSLEGTLTRATWVIDKEGVIRYLDVRDNISDEPDYDGAIAAAKALL